jgi:hypothetical protein
MGMNPSKFDVWPRQKVIRHCWVRRQYRYQVPFQGLVLDWKKEGHTWLALVTYVEDDSDGNTLSVRTEWVEAHHLLEVPSKADDLLRIDPPY